MEKQEDRNSIITLLTQTNHCRTVIVFLDVEKALELASSHVILEGM